MVKEGENATLALAGSVCRPQFVGVTVNVLDVKSLIEYDGEGLKVYHFRDIVICNVLRIRNIRAIIESTNSMIIVH